MKPPSRVRVVGPWRGRWYRAIGAVRSLAAMIGVWRRMPWHPRMVLLSCWEDMDSDRRAPFSQDVGRLLHRAWIGLPSPEAERRLALDIVDRAPDVPPDPGDELPREILQPWRDDIVRLKGGWRPPADVVAAAPLVDGWSLQDRTDHFNLGPGREMLLWISDREGLALTTDGWRRLGTPAEPASNVDHGFVAEIALAWVDRQLYLGGGGDPLGYDTSLPAPDGSGRARRPA